MKLIIDIDEELYEAYKGRPPMLGDAGMDMIAQAIANGTPVPKGHGRLKDADYIKLFSIEHDSWNGVEYEGVIKVVPVIAIDNAPTIIEADKEAENEEV
jgi:hypothetical protein